MSNNDTVDLNSQCFINRGSSSPFAVTWTWTFCVLPSHLLWSTFAFVNRNVCHLPLTMTTKAFTLDWTKSPGPVINSKCVFTVQARPPFFEMRKCKSFLCEEVTTSSEWGNIIIRWVVRSFNLNNGKWFCREVLIKLCRAIVDGFLSTWTFKGERGKKRIRV